MWLHICYLAVLLLSAVVGLLFRKHLKSRNLYLLPFYLLLVFLQELVAAVIAVSTGIIYNIYNPITTETTVKTSSNFSFGINKMRG